MRIRNAKIACYKQIVGDTNDGSGFMLEITVARHLYIVLLLVTL